MLQPMLQYVIYQCYSKSKKVKSCYMASWAEFCCKMWGDSLM